MFKSLAELGAGRRHMVLEAAPLHCSDNRPDRRPAAVLQRARPHGLTCHWQAAASGGGLECHWQIEPADETPAETPEQSSATRQMQGLLESGLLENGLLGFAVHGKPAIRVAIP
jgi:hypothetical protein